MKYPVTIVEEEFSVMVRMVDLPLVIQVKKHHITDQVATEEALHHLQVQFTGYVNNLLKTKQLHTLPNPSNVTLGQEFVELTKEIRAKIYKSNLKIIDGLITIQ